MRRDALGQGERKRKGSAAEDLVLKMLERDTKTRDYTFTIKREGEFGLDITLHPPNSCEKTGDMPGCAMPYTVEAKSVEKLFEVDRKASWPKNRLSRFVLKGEENPECYAFVTRDELTKITAIDFVSAAARELIGWKAKQKKGKSKKLPVRAIPMLRRYPCPLVAKSSWIEKEDESVYG